MSTYDDMLDFLDSTWCAKKYIVPCLVGPAGIGKTAAVKEHAANYGADVVVIIASQILPNEVSGITMPVAESKAMEIYDHYKLSSLKDGDILFFDELLEADQLVLSACLTLIESRQLMSGRLLPDVQIIAATNPTITPMMLKENIRQRFVFKHFDIDPEGTRKYIKDVYGFDVGNSIVQCLEGTGKEYNILTPRSLSKMAAWMAESNGDRQKSLRIATEIDQIWGSTLGTTLREKYFEAFNKPEQQLKVALRHAVTNAGVTDEECISTMFDDDKFEETSMQDLINMLQNLEEWTVIEEMLSNTELVEEDNDTEVRF